MFYRCRRKCYDKVKEEDRNRIYTNFRGMGSKNEQDHYLQSLISASEVKQRRKRKPDDESTIRNRQSSFVYEVSTPTGKTQVCKLAFVNMHMITNERIRRLTTLLIEGKYLEICGASVFLEMPNQKPSLGLLLSRSILAHFQ